MYIYYYAHNVENRNRLDHCPCGVPFVGRKNAWLRVILGDRFSVKYSSKKLENVRLIRSSIKCYITYISFFLIYFGVNLTTNDILFLNYDLNLKFYN